MNRIWELSFISDASTTIKKEEPTQKSQDPLTKIWETQEKTHGKTQQNKDDIEIPHSFKDQLL